MTIGVNDRLSGPYTAIAGQTVFSFDFPAVSDEEVLVVRRRAGVETALVRDITYTVQRTGGTVTLTPAALAGDQYVIFAGEELSRTTQFQGWRALAPATVEAELDQVTRRLQEIARECGHRLRRSYFVPEYSAGGLRITNVGAGTEDSDAPNMGQLNAIAGSAEVAEAAAASAALSAELAQMLAGATGPYVLFDTKASADAGLAGLAEGAYVMVIADETRDGVTAIYQKQAGVYVFKRQTMAPPDGPAASSGMMVVDDLAALATLTAADAEAGLFVDLRYGGAASGYGSGRFVTLNGNAPANGLVADGVAVVESADAARTFVRQELLDRNTLDLAWWSPPVWSLGDAAPMMASMLNVAAALASAARRIRCAIRTTVGVGAQNTLPNYVSIDGEGTGEIKILATLALTDAVFKERSSPAARVRNARFMAVRNLRFDGAARPFPSWLSNPSTGATIADPQADYTSPGVLNAALYPGGISDVVAAQRRNPAGAVSYISGAMIYFAGAEDVEVVNCQFANHGNFVVVLAGCLRGEVAECQFENTGRLSMSSNTILIGDHSSAWLIGAITKANPAVVSTIGDHGFAPGETIQMIGVNWGGNIPTGTYKVGTVPDAGSFTLQTSGGVNVDSSGFASTYALDCEGLAARDPFIQSSDCGVVRNRFANLNRAAVQVTGRDHRILDNAVMGSCECGFFFTRAIGFKAHGNVIEDVKIADLVANGIEVNYCTGYDISDNVIRRIDGNCVSVIGQHQASVSKNRLRRSGNRGAVLRPYGPFSERYNYSVGSPIIAGIAISTEERTPVRLQAYSYMGLSGVVNDNYIDDNRLTPINTAAIVCQRAGGAADLSMKNLEISRNDLTNWPLGGNSPLDLIDWGGLNIVDPQTTICRGNKRHSSQSELYFISQAFAAGTTGNQTIECGYPPSAVEVYAFGSSAGFPVRQSFGAAHKTHASQSASAASCFSDAWDAAAASVTNNASVLAVLKTTAGVVTWQANFVGWTQKGLIINIPTATVGALVHFRFKP